MSTKIDDITITKQTGTVLTLNQKDKFVSDDGFFNIGVQSGAGAVTISSADADVVDDSGARNIAGAIGTKSSTAPVSGYYLEVEATSTGESTITTAGWLGTGSMGTATGTEDVYFPIDTAEAEISGTNTVTPNASLSGTNVVLSNTNNGVSVTATGGGTAAAIVGGTATKAGYLPENAIVSPSTIGALNATTTASSYISGVVLTTPASGTNTFSITVPNGASTKTYTFSVDDEGLVTIQGLNIATNEQIDALFN